MSAALLVTVFILICVALVLLGASAPKPQGWIALGFGVLALLLVLLGKLFGL